MDERLNSAHENKEKLDNVSKEAINIVAKLGSIVKSITDLPLKIILFQKKSKINSKYSLSLTKAPPKVK